MFSLSSYLKELDNISVFNEDTFNKTIDPDNGAYKIVIEAEEPRALSEKADPISITGVIKGGVTLQTLANWGELDVGGIVNGIIGNDALNVGIQTAQVLTQTGGINMESDLQSKKFYTGGSHLTLPLSMRIFDDDDSGKALNGAMGIFSLSLPKNNMNFSVRQAYEALVPEKPKEFFRSVSEKIQNGVNDRLDVVKNKFVKGSTKVVDKTFQNLKTNIVDEQIRVTESPPTVTIRVGNWLVLQKMVIENVSATTSDHNGRNGPQYIDIDFTVSSRYKLILDEWNGIRNVNVLSGKRRVFVSDGTGKFA